MTPSRPLIQRPWRYRSLYTCMALCYLLLLPHYPYTGQAALKVAPILVLLWLAWQNLQGSQRRLLASALFFSGLGDIFLALPLSWSFPAGLGNFLVAQLIYAALFFRSFQWQTKRLIFALAIIVHAAYFTSLLLPKAGAMTPAILAYLGAIATMGLGAVFYRHNLWVLSGAAIFIASDTLIAIDKFLLPFAQADLAIMTTYYLAQILIFHGLLAAVNTSDKHD